jgi:hypothetical protein
MQSAISDLSSSPTDVDNTPTFGVIIAYEDFATGKHAKKTYDFLVENLRRECRFVSQMWKFDVLTIPKLREMAVKDAVMADIIIVSSHGGADLPEEVKAWIEGWLAEKGNAIALVALFDCPPEEALRTYPLRSYLAGVARRGNLEFFAQPDEWPGKRIRPDVLAARLTPGLNHKTLSTLAGVVQRDMTHRRWGSNE